MSTEVMQQKAKHKRERLKIKAKCPMCRARMYRDDNNMAYCRKDGVQEIGRSHPEKGTISTPPKSSAKGKSK